MKIDLLCNDGSPLGVVPGDIYGRGVGGAELAMLTWATTMAARGHKVRIFNDPKPEPGVYDGVEFLPRGAFEPRDGTRDAFIVYRSPNAHTKAGQAAIKVHWSMDQFTVGNYSMDIVPHVDTIVCISPYHVQDYRNRYHPPMEKIGYLDLGVKLADYDQKVEKVHGLCIFCSMPDRGLRHLHPLWARILEQEPGATLVITGDYTLWGAKNPGNHQHRLQWLHTPGVKFVGNIPRDELVKAQLEAQVHAYPCVYKELFCIAAAECQVAGAVPITTPTGALATTNEFGFLLPGNILASRWQHMFVKAVIAAMRMTGAEREAMRAQARARFDWNVICGQWEILLETGRFPEGHQLGNP